MNRVPAYFSRLLGTAPAGVSELRAPRQRFAPPVSVDTDTNLSREPAGRLLSPPAMVEEPVADAAPTAPCPRPETSGRKIVKQKAAHARTQSSGNASISALALEPQIPHFDVSEPQLDEHAVTAPAITEGRSQPTSTSLIDRLEMSSWARGIPLARVMPAVEEGAPQLDAAHSIIENPTTRAETSVAEALHSPAIIPAAEPVIEIGHIEVRITPPAAPVRTAAPQNRSGTLTRPRYLHGLRQS